jgi:RNA polymerase sigma-70 factor (ECF subfamily)
MGEYRGQASVRTWLHRIASNACKNELRRRSRRPEGARAVLEEEGSVMSVPAAAEQDFSLKRRTDRLGRALSALREDDRHLLLMVEFEGYSYAEIAGDLELSVAAIKMRVMRARLALKSAYEELEKEEVPE